jgi:hypothetical protein
MEYAPAVAGKATFDPASARGSFSIAIPYVIGPFVALRLEVAHWSTRQNRAEPAR